VQTIQNKFGGQSHIKPATTNHKRENSQTTNLNVIANTSQQYQQRNLSAPRSKDTKDTGPYNKRDSKPEQLVHNMQIKNFY